MFVSQLDLPAGVNVLLRGLWKYLEKSNVSFSTCYISHSAIIRNGTMLHEQ